MSISINNVLVGFLVGPGALDVDYNPNLLGLPVAVDANDVSAKYRLGEAW